MASGRKCGHRQGEPSWNVAPVGVCRCNCCKCSTAAAARLDRNTGKYPSRNTGSDETSRQQVRPMDDADGLARPVGE